MNYRIFSILLFLCSTVLLCGQSLTIRPDRTLEYHIYENGDRIPDYSYCGYKASEEPIPFVDAVLKVPWQEGDATLRIQRAIDYVKSLPLNKKGFRGAVQLESGYYEIAGSLLIDKSGVVLRGAGYDEQGTVLIGKGTDRSTLIRIAGEADRVLSDSIPIASEYVPLNATVIPLPDKHGLKKGDRIVITRPSIQEWLESIGADQIGKYVDYPLTHWEAGDFDIQWERTITKVSSESITIDVPLTQSLEPKFGGGYIQRCSRDGRISHVGIENLRCVSEYDPAYEKDEEHRWMAITVENAEDGWVRRVTGTHFVSSIVALWETTRRFTVEDCKCLSPVGEIGGFRRYAFQTQGQQTLFQRCYAEYGYHDFSVGFTAAGPNAFVQCYSYRPYQFSGTLGGWSSGTLFDRVTVDGGALKIAFRDVDGQGSGWSGVNSLCWECRVPQLHLDSPPDAYNWAFGTWGQGYGNGSHEMPRKFLKPESFYYAQLEARTGKTSPEKEFILTVPGPSLSQTDMVYAARMSERSLLPELLMDKWIDTVVARRPLPITYNLSEAEQLIRLNNHNWVSVGYMDRNIEIEDGRISTLLGKTHRTALWRGSLRPQTIEKSGLHITRFVPGREGRGFTDNLDSLARFMYKNRIAVLHHFPALWYERRRDDHGRSRRVDADVWAPFYEQPFARSGVGEAFDRLSLYDLNRFNAWYWSRLRKFAQRADWWELLFIQDHYLQHNIIEEGAHWADYPWRSANNINELEFPENTYYAGDKRVFMAEQFYDISHPKRAGYHRKYIRKHLDELGPYNNVVHHLGLEYTGPLHFVKFWLDTIHEWEQETGKKVKTMLSATKDVQDALLQDPTQARKPDILDIRQWHYCKDGSLYAPPGGVSLAQRQYPRIMEEGEDDLDGVFRAVSEYRLAYPDMVVVYNYKRSNERDWVAFLAGGSLCNIPRFPHSHKMYGMKPISSLTLSGKQWGVGNRLNRYLLYVKSDKVTIELPKNRSGNVMYDVQWFDPLTGELIKEEKSVLINKPMTLQSPSTQGVVLWLEEEKREIQR